ncbi:MAG: EAL domain-containing protein [Rhodospirillales bacterium]|nr:EAL domain-containing protein [Rhodospirillales bacterium]
MQTGNGVIKILLQSRVFRRTLFLLFALVMVIEGVFLHTISQAYKNENLAALNDQAQTAFMSLFLTHPYAMSDKMLLATTEMLLPGTQISGGILYDKTGRMVGRFGEPPAPTDVQTLGSQSFGNLSGTGERYDVVWRASDTGAPYTVHARLNATRVQLKTESFIVRAVIITIGLTVLITLGVALLITPTVLVPFARLRQSLGLTHHGADTAADEWREVTESVLRRNGPPRLDGPALEERVEERTRTLRTEIQSLKDVEGKLSRLAALTESASTPILKVSHEGVILYANEPARMLLQHWGAAIGGTLPAPWRDRIAGFLERGVSGEIEESFGERTYALNVVPASNNDAVNIYGYDITQRMLSDVDRAQSGMAGHGGMGDGQGGFAGINGRAVLEERLAHAIAMMRSTGKGGTLHLLEIHDFEQMAATVEYTATNELMRDVMARLRTMLRATTGSEDAVIRFGRARFAIVHENSPEPADAITLAEGLIETLSQPFQNGNQTIRVDASVGITLYPDDAGEAGQLIRNAQMALEHAVGDGPNTLRFFTARLNEEVHKRHTLTADLRQALRDDALTLQYQARLSLKTCRIVGAEALARWPHDGKVLQPADFIPMAESCDVGVALGRWVLNKACQQHKLWLDTRNGHSRTANQSGGPITISVNVSAALALSGDLVGAVDDALQRSGLPTNLLELEFPEGLIMANPESFTAPLVTLNDMGVKIVIDGFGTGYSSVEHLSALPISRIKIDPSFVMHVGKDAQAGRTVKAVAALAQGLNIGVTAVGVETSDQVDFVQTLPIEEIQGFAFAEPMDADAFHAFVENFTEATLSFPAANGRVRIG